MCEWTHPFRHFIVRSKNRETNSANWLTFDSVREPRSQWWIPHFRKFKKIAIHKGKNSVRAGVCIVHVSFTTGADAKKLREISINMILYHFQFHVSTDCNAACAHHTQIVHVTLHTFFLWHKSHILLDWIVLALRDKTKWSGKTATEHT